MLCRSRVVRAHGGRAEPGPGGQACPEGSASPWDTALPLGGQPHGPVACSQPAALPGGFRVSSLSSHSLLSLVVALAELLPS